MKNTNIAIILASGQGKRMGAEKNKTLLSIKGKPLIYWTLKNFEKCKSVDKILLVAKEEEKDFFDAIIKKNEIKKIMDIIPGGRERQDSAFNGTMFLEKNLKDKKNSIAIFHNGANPFVTEREINESIEEAKKWGACVVAHRTKDTIREVSEKGFSQIVLERSKLWNMQTPQSIKLPLAIKAFREARKNNFLGTDDVSLVERLGKKVKIIEGSAYNFKITTPLDLALAKIIIKNFGI